MPGTAKPPSNRPRRARAQAVAQLPPKGKYSADLVGQTIEGKYVLHAVLGRGGMGTVYEAVHRLTNRRVAVKVLLPEHAEKPESIARFHQEARVVSAIGHSNICEILDFGRLGDGRPFLVMERLEGETLGALLERRGRLTVGEAVGVVVQALGALDAAHAKGIIHRDMKPDNVFLAARPGTAPIVKVLDFGISKAFGEDRDVELTRTGMVMGTPYYMAPEQARGDRSLDPRVDVWATGVILYEAIGGVRPFLAKNYNALLVEILTAAHKPLSSVVAGVAGGLEAVIDRALAKRREDRQPTVAALASALAPYAGALPTRSAGPARPRTDRFVEVGGERIPVTWEDTGGETPGSDTRDRGAAEVIHVRPPGLGTALEAPGARRDAQAGRPRVASPGPGRGSASGLTPTRAASPDGRSRAATTRPGGPSAAGTARPPMIEDEDTTKVLLGDPSTDATTPALRRGSLPEPPPPPPEERPRRGGIAPDPFPIPPADDVETTIVDSEPPSFATDLYVAARSDRDKDKREKR